MFEVISKITDKRYTAYAVDNKFILIYDKEQEAFVWRMLSNYKPYIEIH